MKRLLSRLPLGWDENKDQKNQDFSTRLLMVVSYKTNKREFLLGKQENPFSWSNGSLTTTPEDVNAIPRYLDTG